MTNSNMGKPIIDTISSFEVELSDFVFAERYADKSKIRLDKIGARGGTTEALNTYRMKDPLQSEIVLEFSIHNLDDK